MTPSSGPPPGGFTPGDRLPTPRRSSTMLVITLVLIGALVLGFAGIALTVALADEDDGPDFGEPRSVAEEFVDLVFRSADSGEITPGDLDPVVCEQDMPGIRQSYRDYLASQPEGGAGDEASDDPAEAEIGYRVVELSVAGGSGRFAVEQAASGEALDVAPFELVREDGRWQVCGVTPP